MKNIFAVLIVYFLSSSLLYSSEKVTIAFMDRGRTSSWRHLILEETIKMTLLDYEKVLKKRNIKIDLKKFFVPRYKNILVPEITQKAIESNAVVAIGHDLSSHALLAAPKIEKSNLSLISPYATSSKLKFSKNIYQTAGSNNERAQALSHYIQNVKKVKSLVAIVSWNDPYSKNYFHDFEKYFSGSIKLHKVLKDKIYFDKLNLPKKNKHFLLVTFPMQTAILIKKINNINENAIYFGPDSWGETNDHKEQITPITHNLSFTGLTLRKYTKHYSSKEETYFKERIKKRTNGKYSVLAALYYDSFRFVLESIIKVHPFINRNKLNQYMSSNPYFKGILGPICFRPSKCSQNLTYHIIKLDGTGFSYYEKLKL